MPKKMKNKKSNKKKNSNLELRFVEPKSSDQYNNGPLRLPMTRQQRDLRTVELSQLIGITSTGAGGLNTVFPLNIATFDLYASFTNLFDEFRLLSCTWDWVPCAQYSQQGTAVIYNPLLSVIDRDSSNNLTSLANAVDYASVIVRSIDKPQRQVYLMSGSEDAGFVTSSTNVPAWFKIFAQGLSTTTLYGYVVIKGLWQGRGRA
jgi:hypothetical protein